MTLTREAADEKMVNDAFQKLVDSYLKSCHRKKVDIITKAFNFARQAHKGVRRLSGEPYIMHPIAVAQIACAEMGLGSTSICSALLHDVVEDTDYTVEDIQNIFGEKIAQIVDGLTKISGGIFGDQASAQAENFKKLLLTMNDDIRVILIKICDRLHNMRTLSSQPANKQYKIAGETLYIYAPIAYRLGLNKIKSELENLSFHFEHPEEYDRIVAQLQETGEQRDKLFRDFIAPIDTALHDMGLKHRIIARVKTPYSIWSKMQTKHIAFDQVYDILAVRIIFTPSSMEHEINECFDIYVALTKIYKSHPDRLREWLNHPKANGYQALHVTLMSDKGRWIEVQIRSERMDEIAEQGFAAHWRYKNETAHTDDDETNEVIEDETDLNDWLRTIKEILDDPQPDAMDFLDAIKLNLFASEIFVFTPKGEIKTMPAGCTALDFAFSIHTFLGSHCIGAKVNHRLVPLSHRLQSGDQVEILTSNSQHVQPSWVNFVSTAKARAKIQAMLRRDRREIQKRGEQTLTDFLHKHGMELTPSVLDKLCAYHEQKNHEALLTAIGNNDITPGDKDIDELQGKNKKQQGGSKWKKYVPFIGNGKTKDKAATDTHSSTAATTGNNDTPATDGSTESSAARSQQLFVVTKDFNRKRPVYLTESNIEQFVFASCCHVIPGDDALGYIDTSNHIEIHRRSCPVANKLKSSYGNRILDVKWDMHKRLFFDAIVGLKGIDRIGVLSDVSRIVSDQLNVAIRRITLECDQGIFSGSIELRIHDREDVRNIIQKLKSIKGVQEVTQTL